MSNDEDDDKHAKYSNKIGKQVSNAVSKVLQTAAVDVANHTGNSACVLNTVTDGMVAALLVSAPLIAKRPDLTDEQKNNKEYLLKHQGQILNGMVTPESVMFSAILAAVCINSFDAESGLLESSMGPTQYSEALRIWQTVFPNTKPEKFLYAPLLEAIKHHEETTVGGNPLMELVKGLKGGDSNTKH